MFFRENPAGPVNGPKNAMLGRFVNLALLNLGVCFMALGRPEDVVLTPEQEAYLNGWDA